ncbi:hypothetical protein OROMI_007100 [Orobanche minor]
MLVLLIGGILFAMPMVLLLMFSKGSQRFSQRRVVTNRVMAIEKMAWRAWMDYAVTKWTLTLNNLTVDKSLTEVYANVMDKEQVIMLAAMASRSDNQGAFDAAI